jgi:hypothetical protein
MRLIALLSFYDEPAEALAECVQSLARAGCDHVVAVDGAYALYPEGKPMSPIEQVGTIAEAWPGDDWFMVMDADQVVVEVPAGLKRTLADTPHDVAAVRFHDRVAERLNDPLYPTDFDVRILFRAQPIHLELNHYTYVASLSRTKLWTGRMHDAESVTGLDLRDSVTVEHRPDVRGALRAARPGSRGPQREASASLGHQPEVGPSG